MKRMVLVGVAVLIGALMVSLDSTAGAANYPPKAKLEVAVQGKSASTHPGPSSAVEGKSASTHPGPSSAAQGAPLPFTGSNSAELVWAGAALLVAGAALVGHRRRLVRR
jgi:LPXTG-motif cell wall-anchored protein